MTGARTTACISDALAVGPAAPWPDAEMECVAEAAPAIFAAQSAALADPSLFLFACTATAPARSSSATRPRLARIGAARGPVSRGVCAVRVPRGSRPPPPRGGICVTAALPGAAHALPRPRNQLRLRPGTESGGVWRDRDSPAYLVPRVRLLGRSARGRRGLPHYSAKHSLFVQHARALAPRLRGGFVIVQDRGACCALPSSAPVMLTVSSGR
jgi:hypothetical protein